MEKGEFVYLLRRLHLAFVNIAAQVVGLRDVVLGLFVAAFFKAFSEFTFPFIGKAHPPELLDFRKLLGVVQALFSGQRFKAPGQVGIQGLLAQGVDFPVPVPHGLELRPHILVGYLGDAGRENPVLLIPVHALELGMNAVIGRGNELFALGLLLRFQPFHLLLKKRLAFQRRSTAQARRGGCVLLHIQVDVKRLLRG